MIRTHGFVSSYNTLTLLALWYDLKAGPLQPNLVKSGQIFDHWPANKRVIVKLPDRRSSGFC